jgi:RNA polymerase sigma factor (sigma-70 family)
MSPEPVEGRTDVESLLRQLAPQVLGAVVRRYGNFDTAEDGVQEAMLAAAAQWPSDGVPDNPKGWLITVAARRLTDLLRSEQARRRREDTVARWELPRQQPDTAESPADSDDTLILLFMCCHPALTPPSQIALTLRAVGGLTTAEVARAYAVPESTMAQRISRAKATLRELGEPFGLPVGDRLEVRVARVLAVLYLLYNEGYAASTGPDVIRADRCAEAIRLARLTHRLLPSDPEVSALLALVLLLDARRPARVTAAGDLVPLDDQDRSLWDPRLVAEGTALLDASRGGGRPGPYQVQAAIAAVHDRAPTAADTDWPQVLALYGLLEEVAPSPFVTLARAVALAEAEGPDAAEPVLEEAASRLPGNHRVDAVRGHLAELRGDREAARQHYAEASRHATNLAEQRHLTARAARLGRPGDEPGSAAR